MDDKQQRGFSPRKEANLGQKEAEREKSEKQHEADNPPQRSEGGDESQSDVMRRHRQVRP